MSRGGGPVYLPTPAEKERISRAVIELRTKGYAQAAIAKALNVSAQTVSKYARALGVAAGRGRVTSRPTEPIEPIDWRDNPRSPRSGKLHGKDRARGSSASTPIELGPMYLRSTTRATVATMMFSFEQDHAVNRFGHDVADATQCADADWAAAVDTELVAAVNYLHALIAILRDPAVREQARALVRPELGLDQPLDVPPLLVLRGGN